MKRLHFVVEGQTEETFVNSCLALHLGEFDISSDVRCIETSRSRLRVYRGGVLNYGKTRRDLERWMKEDANPDAYFTTMFDLYRLPDDFPGYASARDLANPTARVTALETALQHDLGHPRFIPYLQLHEFEALILSDPEKLGIEFIDRVPQIKRIVTACAGYQSPELIDDGEQTAPSKRIIACLPEYEGRKATAGPRIVREIGMTHVRASCPHFDAWIGTLERLAESPPG